MRVSIFLLKHIENKPNFFNVFVFFSEANILVSAWGFPQYAMVLDNVKNFVSSLKGWCENQLTVNSNRISESTSEP